MWIFSKRWWQISLLLYVPGVIFLIKGILNPGERTDDDAMPLWLFGIVWLGFMLLINAGVVVFQYYQKRRTVYFARNGIPATATILEAETTGTEINNMPQIELCLEIALPGREPYVIRHTSCWNPLSLAALQRGTRWDILVDPGNRNNIMFKHDEKIQEGSAPGAF